MYTSYTTESVVPAEDKNRTGIGRIEIEGESVCSDIIKLMRHTIQKRLIPSHYQVYSDSKTAIHRS
jgi:hypothetical protein